MSSNFVVRKKTGYNASNTILIEVQYSLAGAILMDTFGDILRELRLHGVGRPSTVTADDILEEFGILPSKMREWIAGEALPSESELEQITARLETLGAYSHSVGLIDRLKSAWSKATKSPSSITTFAQILRQSVYRTVVEDLDAGRAWTTERLAAEVGVSADVIRSWEHNRVRPHSEKYHRLKRVLSRRASPEDQELIDELERAWEAWRISFSSDGTDDFVVAGSGGHQINAGAGEDHIVLSEGLYELSDLQPVGIRNTRRGRALFRVARTMWSEVPELAELRLSATDELTVAMRAALERTMVGRGLRTDEFAVEPIGTLMRARLYGEESFFKIEDLSTETQALVGSSLHWDWRVTPRREGRSMLTLRLSMAADLSGTEFEVDAQALHQSIRISVRSWATRPARFVRDNWKWMLGSSGIGALAAAYALLFE